MKIHAEEMSESETAFMLEQGQLGLRRMGDQLGPLAGWFKDNIDQGPSPIFDHEHLCTLLVYKFALMKLDSATEADFVCCCF